jgi:hypothetical protein
MTAVEPQVEMRRGGFQLGDVPGGGKNLPIPNEGILIRSIPPVIGWNAIPW